MKVGNCYSKMILVSMVALSSATLESKVHRVLRGDAAVAPTPTPTSVPSSSPSDLPSDLPSIVDSMFPSVEPTSIPSNIPSDIPSSHPSIIPTDMPSVFPSDLPSNLPSSLPSDLPTILPSIVPSIFPSTFPSLSPSSLPSNLPSSLPSSLPSKSPSDLPSSLPSDLPSLALSEMPSIVPSDIPSVVPSGKPSDMPSDKPSIATTPEPCLSVNKAQYLCGEAITVSFNFDNPSVEVPALFDDWVGIYPCNVTKYYFAEVWHWTCPGQQFQSCDNAVSRGELLFDSLPLYNRWGPHDWPIRPFNKTDGSGINTCFKAIWARNDGPANPPYDALCESEPFDITEGSCEVRAFSYSELEFPN